MEPGWGRGVVFAQYPIFAARDFLALEAQARKYVPEAPDLFESPVRGSEDGTPLEQWAPRVFLRGFIRVHDYPGRTRRTAEFIGTTSCNKRV